MPSKRSTHLTSQWSGVVTAIGTVNVQLTVDEVTTPIEIVVVPNEVVRVSVSGPDLYRTSPHGGGKGSYNVAIYT